MNAAYNRDPAKHASQAAIHIRSNEVRLDDVNLVPLDNRYDLEEVAQTEGSSRTDKNRGKTIPDQFVMYPSFSRNSGYAMERTPVKALDNIQEYHLGTPGTCRIYSMEDIDHGFTSGA